MDNIISLRQQILTEINQLSQEKLTQVITFVNTIKSADANKIEEEIIDPLTDFIGAVNQGNLTENIEQYLYE
jgi:hypothetical protein